MNKNSGFTVIELLVVISILLALVLAGGTSWYSFIPGYRLNTAIGEVQAALQMAKLKAIKENASTRMTLNATTGIYQAFVDDDGDGNPDTGFPVFVSKALPPGITVAATSDTAIALNSRGFPTAGANFRLKNGRNEYKGLDISSAGSVVAQTSTNGVLWTDL